MKALSKPEIIMIVTVILMGTTVGYCTLRLNLDKNMNNILFGFNNKSIRLKGDKKCLNMKRSY